jgi:DNA-binding beta-propeller fold protein YncE
LKPAFIIAIVAVAMIGVMVPSAFAQLDDNFKMIDPQPVVSEFIPNSDLLIKKIEISDWIIGQAVIDEKNKQLFLLTVKSPHPGYGQEVAAIALMSTNINQGKYSNFKSIEFENIIEFDINSKTNKLYLFEQEKQNILVIDYNSLKIIDEITVNFEPPYRQRDIAINENTNKIYLLLEEMVGRTAYEQEYKIQVFDGTTKKMIKEIELNEPASELFIDQTNNLVYADNWVGQKYFILDNNENLSILPLPITSNQFIQGTIINPKTNQLFVSLGNNYGHMQEILVLDTLSGKEIQHISDSKIMFSPSIISQNQDMIFFTGMTGITIMNIEYGENKIVREIPIPEVDLGYLNTLDDESGKLYANVQGGMIVYDIETLIVNSNLGISEIHSATNEEYISCWKNIQKLDSSNAKEFYTDGKINQYWEQSEIMYNDMIDKCEEIKTLAIEEAEVQEQIMKEQRLGFPDSVDSRCDLVYLINREGESRGILGLAPEESTINEIKSMTLEYQQRISDEPWNAEELGQDLLDKIKNEMVDSIMKKYSIHSNLRSAIFQLITPIGSYDTDILRGILLMEPKHYAEDVECGRMLKTHYYDDLFKLNSYAYGIENAEKMGIAIDKVIGMEDKKINPVSTIKEPTDDIQSQENSNSKSQPTCGPGTEDVNGICQVIQTEEKSSKGGGCLIATATYGSELAPQVQQLRELRDNQLLQTESGAAFMGTFNDIYYSFSPIIADYERENPYFKEAVKIAITPMISSLSLMENANSESEVLGIGISVIVLNLGMYLGVPAIVVIGIRKIK